MMNNEDNTEDYSDNHETVYPVQFDNDDDPDSNNNYVRNPGALRVAGNKEVEMTGVKVRYLSILTNIIDIYAAPGSRSIISNTIRYILNSSSQYSYHS